MNATESSAEREARIRRETSECASKLKVTICADNNELYLMVDASDLATSPNDVRSWSVDPSPDNPDRWHHGPSHGGEYFALSDVLLGIAACYTERFNAAASSSQDDAG